MLKSVMSDISSLVLRRDLFEAFDLFLRSGGGSGVEKSKSLGSNFFLFFRLFLGSLTVSSRSLLSETWSVMSKVLLLLLRGCVMSFPGSISSAVTPVFRFLGPRLFEGPASIEDTSVEISAAENS